MKSDIIIPEIIKYKRIPYTNKSIFTKLLDERKIQKFSDLGIDIIKKIYDSSNKNQFLDFINSLNFFGVKYTGRLAKYNYFINNDDKKFIIKKNEKNLQIKFDYLSKNIVNSFTKFGIEKSFDLLGIPFYNLKYIFPDSYSEDYFRNFLNIHNLELGKDIEFRNFELLNEIEDEFIYRYENYDEKVIKVNNNFSKKYSYTKNELRKKIKKDNRFYKISSASYFLKKILEREIESRFEENKELLLNSFENICLKILKRKAINRKEFKNYLMKSNKYDYIKNENLIKMKFNFNKRSKLLNEILKYDSIDKIEEYLISINLNTKKRKLVYDRYFDDIKKNNFLENYNENSLILNFIINKLDIIKKYNKIKLLNNYIINNKKNISVKKAYNDFNLLGFHINEEKIIKFLNKKKNMVCISPDRYAFKDEKNHRFLGDFNKAIVYVKNTILNNKKNRDIEIILKRLEGKTLQEIGDSVDISRERVRQIFSKFEKSKKYKIIQKYFMPYYNQLFENYSILDLSCSDKLQRYFSKVKIEYIKFFFSTLYKKDITLCFNFLIIENDEKNKFINKLTKNIKDIRILKKVFERNKIMKGKNVKKFLLEYCHYTILDNKLLIDSKDKSKKITKTSEVKLLIKEKYKQGINLYDKKELEEFKKILNQSFSNEYKNDSNRNIRTKAMNNNDIIRCDSGKFIHINNINLKKEQLAFFVEIIDRYFEKDNIPEIWSTRILKSYPNKCKNMNINNKEKMYDLLRYYYSDKFYYIKSPRILPSKLTGKKITYTDLLENRIHKFGKAGIDRDNLKKYFIDQIGWPESTFNQNISNCKKIIMISDNKLANINHFDINKKLLKKIKSFISLYLKKNQLLNYTRLYNKKIAFAKAIGVSNKYAFYNIIKYYYEDKFEFRGKNIYSKNKEINIKKYISNYVKSKSASNPILKDKVINHFRKEGIDKTQVYSAIYNSNEIFEYIQNLKIIHKNNLNIPLKYIKIIKSEL